MRLRDSNYITMSGSSDQYLTVNGNVYGPNNITDIYFNGTVIKQKDVKLPPGLLDYQHEANISPIVYPRYLLSSHCRFPLPT